MNYIIKNSKNVFIRLGENGQPLTCSDEYKQSFEFSKAKNILGSLPKTMKRMRFRVEPIPEIVKEKEKEIIEPSVTYEIPKGIDEIKDKLNSCIKLIDELRERKDDIAQELHENNQRFTDVRHKIELEKDKNMYEGYLLYVETRTLLRKRRELKDEKSVIDCVLNMKMSNLSIEQLENMVEGLKNRKYEFRTYDCCNEKDED